MRWPGGAGCAGAGPGFSAGAGDAAGRGFRGAARRTGAFFAGFFLTGAAFLRVAGFFLTGALFLRVAGFFLTGALFVRAAGLRAGACVRFALAFFLVAIYSLLANSPE
jgi:hypothetical protein